MFNLLHPDTLTEELMLKIDLLSNMIPYAIKRLSIVSMIVILGSTVIFYALPYVIGSLYSLMLLCLFMVLGMSIIYYFILLFFNLVDELYYLFGYRIGYALKLFKLGVAGIVSIKIVMLLLLIHGSSTGNYIVFRESSDLTILLRSLGHDILWYTIYLLAALFWSLYFIAYGYLMNDLGVKVGLISFRTFAWMKIITALLTISFWIMLSPRLFETWIFFEILSYLMIIISLDAVKERIYEKMSELIKEPDRIRARLIDEVIV